MVRWDEARQAASGSEIAGAPEPIASAGGFRAANDVSFPHLGPREAE